MLSGGLLDLQDYKLRNKSRKGVSNLNCASSTGTSNQNMMQPATPPDSAMSHINRLRKREFEDILRQDSVDALDAEAKNRLEECVHKLLKGEPILDIHTDFVSRPGKEFLVKMKKATYEMDQLITDHYYGD